MITLYHHGSSVCAAKVRLLLAEKNIPWDGVYYDILKGEQFNPEYLAINPKGLVPAIVDDGKIVTESTVICEYLDDQYPDLPMKPADALLRARMRIWTKRVDEALHPACKHLTFIACHRHIIRRYGIDAYFAKNTDDEWREHKRRWAEEGFASADARQILDIYVSSLVDMDKALADQEWLAGDQFSIADIALAPYVNRLAMLDMAPLWQGKLTRVERWFDRVRHRPTFNPALIEWIPADLAQDLKIYGGQSMEEVRHLLS